MESALMECNHPACHCEPSRRSPAKADGEAIPFPKREIASSLPATLRSRLRFLAMTVPLTDFHQLSSDGLTWISHESYRAPAGCSRRREEVGTVAADVTRRKRSVHRCFSDPSDSSDRSDPSDESASSPQRLQ